MIAGKQKLLAVKQNHVSPRVAGNWNREQILIERVIVRDLAGEQTADNDDCDPDQGKQRKWTAEQPGEETGRLGHCFRQPQVPGVR